MTLKEKFLSAWKQKFAPFASPPLVAVSGGVDSMVLSHLFHDLEIPFAVGHCNFQLREEDASADEDFVRQWCERRNIPCYTVKFDTAAIARESKKGIQETARDLRYDWLEIIRKTNGYAAIATAHHANDNAETVLMNLFKGTGIRGLHGIPEINQKIIRPLLFANRREIEEYAEECSIVFREDASNKSDKYLRNAVRLRIIPAIEEVFPEVITRINENIRRFAEAELIYDKQIKREVRRLTEKRGRDVYVPVRKLERTDPLTTIAYEIFRPFGFSPAQIPRLLQLCHAQGGQFITSPTHKVIRYRDFLVITESTSGGSDLVTVSTIPASLEINQQKFHFSLMDRPSVIPTEHHVAFIDWQKITMPLILRRWKTGDYFYPLGMGMRKKKLSKFFIDLKIPLHQKEQVWVVESDKRIVWVVGLRIDERFKIRTSTTQVLKMETRMQQRP